MTILIILFCSIAIIGIFIIDDSKLFSPIKFFSYLWGFILMLSCIHIGILEKPSVDAYVLLMTMISSFLLGSLICKYKNKKKNVEIVKRDTQVRKKLFYALCIIYILFNLIDISLVLKYRMQGVPMWQIRNWYLQPFGSVNPILSRRTFVETLFRNIVLEPMGLLIYPVAAYTFFTKRERKEKIISLLFAVLCLLTISIAGGGGRLVYIFFVLSYLLAYISLYKTNKISKDLIKKYKKVLFIFVSTAFIGTVIITLIRVKNESFLTQTYKYFAMPPTLLSEWLNRISGEPYTFGLLTTFGIHSYFFRTLNQIGLTALVPNIFTRSFGHILNAEKFITIGTVGTGNAFVTPVYYFYLDGGFVFVVMASLFFGFLVEHVFNKIDNNLNVRNFMIYMIIMYGILVSFMRIQTAIPSYIIAIVFVYILTKRDLGEQHEEK